MREKIDEFLIGFSVTVYIMAIVWVVYITLIVTIT